MRMFLVTLLLLPAAAASANCNSDVNDAFAKLRKTPAFSLETKITNEQGVLTMSNDYVLPDRMHQRVSLSSDGPGTMEMVLIGPKAWSNQGAGWVPLPPQFVSQLAEQMKRTVTDPPKETSEFVCLGDVELDGKAYAAFQTKRATASPSAEMPTKPGPTMTVVQTVYVDKTTGLPAHNIVTPESDPKKRLFDGTFSLREGITIEEPKG